MKTTCVRTSLLGMAALFAIGLFGCADSTSDKQPEDKNKTATNSLAKGDPTKDPKGDPGHQVDDTIDGFWCAPHGLPEDECWKCSRKYRELCKQNGDWCAEHLRPKSQCFKCDPTLIAKWAKVYESKTGKTAPKPEEY